MTSLLWLATVLALLAAPSAASAATMPSAGGTLAALSTPANGPERRTVTVGDVERPYLLVRPAGRVLGAVLVAHAQNQTMGQAQQSYGLGYLRERGQLVAYLGGYKGSWNAGTCCGAARAEGRDDIGYVRAVQADLRELLPEGRPTTLVGVSSGAMLAWTVVCHGRLDLKLVLSVSGTRAASCSSSSVRPPYRFLELHGSRDTTIPLRPPSRHSRLLGMTPLPTRPALDTLVSAAGCTRRVPHGTARTDWGGCRGGGVVRLLVERAGHSYGDLRAPVVLARALEEIGATRG